MTEIIKLYFFYTGEMEFYIALLSELIIPSFINLFCHLEGRNDKGYQRPITRMRLKSHFCDFRIMKPWPVSEMLKNNFSVGYFSDNRILAL